MVREFILLDSQQMQQHSDVCNLLFLLRSHHSQLCVLEVVTLQSF